MIYKFFLDNRAVPAVGFVTVDEVLAFINGIESACEQQEKGTDMQPSLDSLA